MNPLGAELSSHRGRCPNAHRLGIAFGIVGVICGIYLFARHPEGERVDQPLVRAP
jgi:hypothetical protein